MKSSEFQTFLFKSAVMVMACDGEIAESEIIELKSIVESEIYFLGYDYTEPLEETVLQIRLHGKKAINNYLDDFVNSQLSPKQELILIEVLIRMIEADSIIQPSEIHFLQLVKSKLKTSEELLLSKFPKQVGLLSPTNTFDLLSGFTSEIELK